MSLTLDKVVYFFLHPVKSLSSDNTDGEGIDPFYVLSAFIALGIWLVIEREKRARNSPVPFGFIIPKVSESLLSLMTHSFPLCNSGSRS